MEERAKGRGTIPVVLARRQHPLRIRPGWPAPLVEARQRHLVQHLVGRDQDHVELLAVLAAEGRDLAEDRRGRLLDALDHDALAFAAPAAQHDHRRVGGDLAFLVAHLVVARAVAVHHAGDAEPVAQLLLEPARQQAPATTAEAAAATAVRHQHVVVVQVGDRARHEGGPRRGGTGIDLARTAGRRAGRRRPGLALGGAIGAGGPLAGGRALGGLAAAELAVGLAGLRTRGVGLGRGLAGGSRRHGSVCASHRTRPPPSCGPAQPRRRWRGGRAGSEGRARRGW